MIIDSHVHIGETEKSKRFWTFQGYAELMGQVGIDKTVAMPNISNNFTSIELNNELLNEYSKLSKDMQDRFELLLLFDPRDNLIKYLNDIPIDVVGLKYHPSVTRVPVNDKSLDEYIELSEYKKWYILVHCGRDPVSDIDYLIVMAKKYPKSRFVAAHLGGNAGDRIERALNHIVSNKVDNIWLDTSNGKLPWLISTAIEKVGKDKILFGSDEPYADVRVEKYIVDLSGEFSVFSENWEALCTY